MVSADYTFSDLAIGTQASFEENITAEMIDAFADLSGDHNPLHCDETYAGGTAFGGRIAHGMLGGALLSRLIGMHLPGRRSVYLSQTLFFRKPIHIGSTIVVSGEVVQKMEAHAAVRIAIRIADRDSGEIMTDGEAVVRVLP